MQRRGFTLLEVLTVIFIFGVLVSISGYVYSSALARSRDNTRKSDLQTIKNALEQFYLDNKAYPGFDTLNSDAIPATKWQLEKDNDPSAPCPQNIYKKFLTPGYISSIPEDPQKKLLLATICTLAPSGEYLYYSLPKPPALSPVARTGYYLIAKMERETNKNYSQFLSQLQADLTAQTYGTTPSIGASPDQYNYIITNINSRNN